MGLRRRQARKLGARALVVPKRVLAGLCPVDAGNTVGMRWLSLTVLISAPACAQDQGIAPFPPGPDAILTKQICAHCHDGRVVVGKQYDNAAARRYWTVMIGTDPGSPVAQRVIAYLTTVLGTSDDDGPDAIR